MITENEFLFNRKKHFGKFKYMIVVTPETANNQISA